MPSNHLILCHPLLLLPSIFPSIRVFSNELALCIMWSKYWSFSFRISPANEYSGLISFRIDWLDLLAVQGTLKSLLQHHSSKASVLQCSSFFVIQVSHLYMTTGKTTALTIGNFVICYVMYYVIYYRRVEFNKTHCWARLGLSSGGSWALGLTSPWSTEYKETLRDEQQPHAWAVGANTNNSMRNHHEPTTILEVPGAKAGTAHDPCTLAPPSGCADHLNYASCPTHRPAPLLPQIPPCKRPSSSSPKGPIFLFSLPPAAVQAPNQPWLEFSISFLSF